MQSIFLTQSDIISPRWQLAFPQAQVVLNVENLPDILSDILLWILVPDAHCLNYLPQWISAGARVVVLTKIENPVEARQVLEQGASGYCHYLAAEPVLEQIKQVIQMGGLWVGADLMRQLVVATANTLVTAPSVSLSMPSSMPSLPMPLSRPLSEMLTLRETSVARAVAAGKSNKEIARDLTITERTVKAHLSAVFEKLQVRDRLHLVLTMAEKYH